MACECEEFKKGTAFEAFEKLALIVGCGQSAMEELKKTAWTWCEIQTLSNIIHEALEKNEKI